MKPYDGGQWIGVSRIRNRAELERAYDESGQRIMHLQAAVEGFDVFARSLSIGPETMVMKFRPELPMHDRYAVAHDFLSPELGEEVLTISRLVNAFFRWEFNSCECLVRGAEVHPIDYANASPDVALTSLHYYFPWAIKTLLKWCTFCLVTGRRPRLDLDTRSYFEVADRDDLSYAEKLAAYRRLADDYFEADRYHDFCASRLAHVDEVVLEWVDSPEFDRFLIDTVRATYPPHEHERFAGAPAGTDRSVGARAARIAAAQGPWRTSSPLRPSELGTAAPHYVAATDSHGRRRRRPRINRRRAIRRGGRVAGGSAGTGPAAPAAGAWDPRRRAAAPAARRRSGASARRRCVRAPRRRRSRRRRGARPTGAAGFRGPGRRIVGDHVHLGVVEQRVRVEIGRPDREPAVVDDGHLGVDVQPVVAVAGERANRRGQQPAGVVVGADEHAELPHRVVLTVVGAGREHDHQAELVARGPAQLVREEVGRSRAPTGTGSRGR